MCGIFCAIDTKKNFIDTDYNQFHLLTDLVKYRGPNSSDYKIYNTLNEECTPNNFNIFLGHRRLAILDLSIAGNQPMSYDNLTIVHNGEIFNFVEIRNELENLGEKFFSNSDTEVILKTYKRFGTKSFSKFNGMWAFIILDHSSKKIIISRDRFSIKPLFYYATKNRYYFASEIKQLLPLIPFKKLNDVSMFKFLKQSISDYDHETFFEEIFRVKPKTNLVLDLISGNSIEEEYWQYELNDCGSEKEVFNNFKDLFYDSVKIRLRSDVEIGALLSGGLDSSSIAVISDRLTNGNIKTFSIISADKRYSEEKFIDLLLQSNTMHNKKIIFNADDIKEKIEEVIFHQDEPFGSFSIIAQYMIFSKIKENSDITVVLSGQGGDEILLGYMKFFYFYLQSLHKRKRYDKLIKEIFASLFYRTVLLQNKISLSKRYLSFFQNRKTEFITLNSKSEETWKFNSLSDRQRTDIDKYSIPNLTRYEDRNSMAFSLETRLPFLDHRLVNLLLNVKDELKIKNGWPKYILRKSLTELPYEIRWRRDKRSFVIPEDSWLKSDFRVEINKIFKDSTLAKLGCINEKQFLNYYQSYLNGNKMIHHSDISRVFIAEKWANKYFN